MAFRIFKEATVLERSRQSITPQQRRLLQQRRRQAAHGGKLPSMEQSRGHREPMGHRGNGLLKGDDSQRVGLQVVAQNTLFAKKHSAHPQEQPRSLIQLPHRRTAFPSRNKKLRWVGQIIQLGLCGVGLAAIVGTTIAVLHPLPKPGTLSSSLSPQKGSPTGELALSNVLPMGASPSAPLSAVPLLDATKELETAKAEIQSLLKSQPDLTAGLFFYDPENGTYVDLNGDQSFAAASTIKLPLLIAIFQEVDAGNIQLDEQWVMRKDLIATEAGTMQYQPVGTKFSALETIENMITVSDNTATNMVLDRLGKAEAVNQRFQSWGLTETVIHNPLPDLEGTNLTSAKDLTTLMTKVSQGELLTPHSRDRALEIMRHTVTDTMLPQGLEKGAIISHKTGDIGTVVGDSGLINMPTGQRYLATVMMKRPYNDPRGPETIRKISQIMYQAFKKVAKSDPVKPTNAAPAEATP
jgi:beta-lactamase class A